jgi:hypothetical protein
MRNSIRSGTLRVVFLKPAAGIGQPSCSRLFYPGPARIPTGISHAGGPFACVPKRYVRALLYNRLEPRHEL